MDEPSRSRMGRLRRGSAVGARPRAPSPGPATPTSCAASPHQQVPGPDHPAPVPAGPPGRRRHGPPRPAPSCRGCRRRKRGRAAGTRGHRRAVAPPARWPPRRSVRRSSSSARSSRRARACSRPSWSRSSSAAATRCRPSRSTSCAATVEAELGRPLEDGLRVVRARRRSPPRRSPRSTPPGCAPARTSSSRCSAPTSAGSSTPTCGRWPGWRRTSSGASRSPRWPTRRRSSSCSPTRSSRSSTSASRPPTCSTSRRCSTSSARTATSCPARTPTLVTRRVLVMERLARLQVRRRRRHAGGRRRHRGRRAHGRWSPSWRAPMIDGIFHGDLHGGNLLVLPDGRTGLLDYGIVGRLSEPRRDGVPAADGVGARRTTSRARWRRCATSARCRRTPTSQAVIRDLGLDQAPVDPTTLTGDEMVKEVQRVVKGAARLRRPDAQGADAVRQEHGVPRRRHRPPRPRPRHPRRDRRHLGAVRPAPRRPGRPRARVDPTRSSSTSTASRPASASTPSVDRLTHRELQARRALIQQRMRDHVESLTSCRAGLASIVADAAGDRPLLGRLRGSARRPTCPRPSG